MQIVIGCSVGFLLDFFLQERFLLKKCNKMFIFRIGKSEIK